MRMRSLITARTGMMRPSLASLLVVLFFAAQAPGLARTRDLTEAEARELAVKALTPEARGLPRLSLGPDAGLGTPGFYWFEATADNPNGSPILGHFAVNRATGAVWDPVWCKELKSSEIKRLQAVLRKRIHLGRRELHGLEAKAPCEP
jgi:hypothetical protein